MCGLRGLNVSIIYVYYTCYMHLNNLPECMCPEGMYEVFCSGHMLIFERGLVHKRLRARDL